MFLFGSSSVSALAAELTLNALATVFQVTAFDIVIVCLHQGDGGCTTSYVSFAVEIIDNW